MDFKRHIRVCDKRDGYLDLPPMERPYKCRVLQHFPEYSPNYPFDEESTALVTMPQGLNVFSHGSPLFQRFQLPQRHTFIITREDGTRVHGLTLLFSELVTHEGFKEAVNSLQMMYATDLQSRKLSLPTKDEFNLEVMEQHFEIEKDSLFTTKAIGLLSRHPFIYGLFNWLEDLWAMMYISPNTKCLQSAFEQCIHNILFRTKLPTVGHYVTFSTPFRTHYAYRPAPISSISNLMNGQLHQNYCVELSLFEYSIQELFELIDLDDFIRLFTCTLLEYRIILFSKVYYRLMLIAECVTCLLLPFYWPHVYAPILPVSLTHFVDAPVPFIMGINIPPDSCNNQNKKYPFMKQYDLDSRFHAYFYPSSIELASEANVCYVYIDEGRVIVPDEIPQFPNYQDIKQSLFDILKLAKYLSKNFNNQSAANQNTVQRLTNISQQPASTSSAVTHTAPVLRPKPPSSLTNANDIQRGPSLSRPEQPQSVNGQGETTTTNVNGQQVHIGNSSTSTSATCCILESNQTTHFAICLKAAKQIISKEVYSGYTELLHINAAVRNLFLANFTMIFQDYENYLILDRNIQQKNNLENISSGLEAFDKVGFLSDQPETHLPFLSAFLETQMFASFLDSRINWHNLINNLSLQNNTNNNEITSSPPMHLTVFHLLLSKSHHERKSVFRSNNSTVMNTSTVSSENIRYDSFLDYYQQKSSRSIDSHFPGFNAKPVFESIHYQLNINNNSLNTLQKSDIKNSDVCNGNNSKLTSRNFVHTYHQLADLQRNGMAQANWDFVDALLEECKHRTKRMVLKKIGQEAIEMGHGDPNISVVEENTLVSGLCDLLERIWSHGLNKKLGNSALWSHLVLYVKRVELMKRINKDVTVNDDCELMNLESSPPTSSSSCGSSPLISDPRSRANLDLVDMPKSNQPPKTILSYRSTRFPWHDLCDSSTPTTTSSSLSKMSSSLTNWRIRLRSNSSIRTQSDSSWHKDFNPTTFRLGQSLNNSNNAGNNSSGGGGTGVSGSFNPTDISSAGMILDLRKIFGPQFIEHSLIDDIHAIQSMKTVKTDIGFARAFVRLALEKKLLSSHLNRLLMDTKLLRHLYTRYAFLRCEEEREQFLVHLLSLNAVDYFSFTRMINQTEVIYEIFLCTGRKHSSGITSTANAWLKIHGHFGSTQVITVPRGHNLIEIKNRNLGLLSTIQIGHDNSGSAPKWFIEFILVYNRTTNHLYLFPCCHWFGLGIEDDALERVLIGEQIRIASNDPRLLFTSPSSDPIECSQNLPNRCSSPSLSRRNSDRKNLSAVMIHERVASAVNRLLKFFCKTSRTNATTSLTSLWCGEHGLVPALHLVFTYGFRSSRIFQRKIYVWDYFEKVASDFSVELRLTTQQQQSNMDLQMLELQNCTGTISFPFSTHSLPRSLTSKSNRSQQDNNKADQLSSTFSPVIKSSYGLPHSPSFSFMNETYSMINSPNEQKYASGRYNLFSFSQPTSPALSRFIPNNSVLSQNTSTDIPVNRRLASMSSDMQHSALQFTMYVQNVTSSSIALGKKGKFERFICRALRDHLLSNWLSILAISPITLQMYEPRSFLLNHDLRQIIQELLSSLDEFNLSFESALLGEL
ncbi:hypothetical protein MN116_000965 [Schistosoma mekongi]|uniref:DENN domain-containing protein 5B n=1 Tax=Schistosoma mekongi TaxID=38744 RepID=A0AAE1ZLN2_SCHME|nr:hypothetical protein MN116_000965 [Schistosoma mekongi]